MLKKIIYKICEQKLYFLNYSKNTLSIYLHYINEFLQNSQKPIQRINTEDFQNYLNNYQFTSISQQNQIISVIIFLYKFGLEKIYDNGEINSNDFYTILDELKLKMKS